MKTLRLIILAAIAVAGISSTGQAADPADPSRAFGEYVSQLTATTRSMVSRATGYIPVGDKMTLGPLPTFIGYNRLEGLRLGLGASSTPAFSPRMRLSGYVAYGFLDHRWKYDAEAMWMINPSRGGSFDTFPVKALAVGFNYDIYPPGSESLGIELQNRPLRLSFTRSPRMLYRRRGRLRYVYEPDRRTELSAMASRERYYPSRFLDFIGRHTVDAWRIGLEATWRPRGDFFQAADRRIDTKPMALRLRGRIQWVEGAQRADETTLVIAEIVVDKVYPIGRRGPTLSILGHATFTAGHGLYPLLPSLPSGPYLIRRLGAFALLKPMELAADRYIDLHARVDDGGLILRQIRVLKPLGIAFSGTIDGAIGAPYCLRGPSISSGPLSWSRPYGEVAVGLDHLLGMLRVEYAWRLSYRSLPGASRSGITLGLDLTF